MKNKLFITILVFCLLAALVSAQDEENINCMEDWTCTAWSECMDGYLNRTCNDQNFCGTQENKPQDAKSCDNEELENPNLLIEEPDCTENWKCGPWSSCTAKIQTRNCFDENSCNTNQFKPNLEQSCVSRNIPIINPPAISKEPEQKEPNNNLLTYFYWLIRLIILGSIGYIGFNYFIKKNEIPQVQKVESKRVDSTDALTQYINKMRAAGYNPNQIRQNLVKAGYDQQLIESHLPTPNPRLKKYTKQMQSLGYNFEQIKDNLIQHGYNNDFINENFKK